MKRAILTTLAALLVAPAALAMPMEMPIQGVLRDNAGTPVAQGEFPMTFAIYETADAADPLWTESLGVTVAGGQFRLNLGTITPLEPLLFAASGALWLGITVESEPELPRRPMGTTPYAFQSASASNLACSGCVEPEALSPASLQVMRDEALIAVTEAGYPMVADDMAVDAEALGVEATSVQGALETLKGLIETETSAGNVNEGAGTVRAYTNQWGLPSYGTATDYVHVINPSPPKVQLYLYGGENTGFASSNNLIVTNTYTPNSYAGGVNGAEGEDSLQIGNNASAFNIGDHVLIHQTVGNSPGHWELNAVKSVQGTALGLAKPLVHTYESATGDDQRRAQVVVAASYNHLEVVNGGLIRPDEGLGGNNDANLRGGIVYVRAQAITVKTGGKIQANGEFSSSGYAGFWGGDSTPGGQTERGQSECSIKDSNYGNSNNCSGGGGGYHSGGCGSSSHAAGGGGGNRTAGQNGQGGGNVGTGGATKGSSDGATLEFGGGGGIGRSYDGGKGGGIIVLGAKTIIVESGGEITANGGEGNSHTGCYPGGGGGAGGSVVLIATTIDIQGTVEAAGGDGGLGWSNKHGGDGGQGWVLELEPIPGAINQSYATGVQIWVDGQEITPLVGDPNAKGSPHWNATEASWGATGTDAWSTGPLDLTNVANWTLGEHTLQFRETGGAGGDLKSYLYLIQPFSESTPPVNDTCQSPVNLDLTDGPVVLSGTTEDVMGKTLATDASSDASCGGEGGPDVVYQITLAERSLINAVVTAPFYARLYVRSADCTDGDVVYCGANELQTTPLEAGDYFLFVDSDASSQKGNFTLAVSLTSAVLPEHDTCAGATPLIFSQNGVATHASTTLYSLDQYQSWCEIGQSGPDVVYSFTAGTGQSISITAASAVFDPILVLYKGECGTAEPMTCSADGTLVLPSQGGDNYFLVIDGDEETDWGAYDLTVTLL